MNKLYAAYGSTLNRVLMKAKCPNAQPFAKSWLFDHALVFKGTTPGGARATLEPARGEDVPLVVWEIDPDHEKALDAYHEVADGLYEKAYLTIEVAGELREVLFYLMTPQPYGFPNGAYVRAIRQGYNDFRFDLKIFEKSITRACENAVRQQLYIQKGGDQNGDQIYPLCR